MVHVRSFVLTILIVVVLSASAGIGGCPGKRGDAGSRRHRFQSRGVRLADGRRPRSAGRPRRPRRRPEGTVGRRQRQQPVPALHPTAAWRRGERPATARASSTSSSSHHTMALAAWPLALGADLRRGLGQLPHPEVRSRADLRDGLGHRGHW